MMMARVALLALAAAMGLSASGTANAAVCTVDAKANGTFGTLNNNQSLPLVPCFNVTARGTVTIKTQPGTWNFGDGPVDAKGKCFAAPPEVQIPLQEAVGLGGGPTCAAGALIGVFVPKSVVQSPGFSPVDNTKNLAPVGIAPNTLFFVGPYSAFEANGPGTLFLGINDGYVGDNSGSLTVTILKPF